MQSHKHECAILDPDNGFLLKEVREVGPGDHKDDMHARQPRIALPAGHDVRSMVGKYRWHVTQKQFVPLTHFDTPEADEKKPHAMRVIVKYLMHIEKSLGGMSEEDKKILADWRNSVDAGQL